ncbi:hypothetical protein [Aeromonas veronii]|uniref:hypothetical protein n=1 Tax=Aeromonas veronii TaxID=654 RepID=UPI00130538FD|nr:hypothetical protein [Aeromonas veronii]
MVTSPDIENQKLFLMLDAVSAHTDCLIQIVKERRNSVLLREWNSTQPPSRVKPYFQRLSRLPTWLSALPLALSMWRIIEIWITLARVFSNKIRIFGSTVH